MKRIKSELTQVVLVCGKCTKKQKAAFGPKGDQPFVEALRDEIARRGGTKPARKLRRKGTSVAVVEVPCLKICPKEGVVTINAREPGRWHVVTRGASFDELLAPAQLPLAAE